MELMQLLVLLVPMFCLIALGFPIFLSMGLASGLYIWIYDLPLMVLAQSMIRGLSSYDYLALPFYFLAGELMNQGGITRRLIKFSQALIGNIKGGLSHVNIVASMVFSGVSGSAIADTSAIGSVIIPAMKEEGYPGDYTAAVTAASATIGPIIPPSIQLVLFGLIAQVSIGKLFLAGALPGILMGIYLLVTSYIISRRRNFPAGKKVKRREFFKAFFDALPALIMPLIILGGITSGIVTATEAGVIAVAYGFIVGCLVYREIPLKRIPDILGQTMLNSGAILVIIASTGLFCWIVASMGLGDVLIRAFTGVSENKWVILGMLNIFFLIWGCIMDPVTAVVILVPMLMPMIQDVGIDPVHFGVVVTMNLMIGMITPPMGLLLFLTSIMAGERFEKVLRETVPFLIALLVVLVICTYWPQLVLWLPRHLL